LFQVFRKEVCMKGKTETWEVGRVKGCMRAGLCEKHHMVHPCPEITETWEEELWKVVQKIHKEHRAIYPMMTIFIRKLLSSERETAYQEGRKDERSKMAEEAITTGAIMSSTNVPLKEIVEKAKKEERERIWHINIKKLK
jgi:hypothetical protein